MNTPVRPKIAKTKTLTHFEETVEEVRAVEGVEDNADEEITWWKPRESNEDEEDEEQVEEAHPLKWWSEENKGLSQDGAYVCRTQVWFRNVRKMGPGPTGPQTQQMFPTTKMQLFPTARIF